MAKKPGRLTDGRLSHFRTITLAAVWLPLLVVAVVAVILTSRGGLRFGNQPAAASPLEGTPAQDATLEPTPSETPTITPPAAERERPFYGMQYVPINKIGFVADLGVEVILTNFPHDGPAEDWLAYLDTAHEHNIKVVAWLWPPGWEWDGTSWQIDEQAREFVLTVADHPALLAVYSLHEPYWMGCEGCGYTTAEQQMLYSEIKAMADVPVWSAVDSMAFWSAQGEETAFADGICDYCETWYYPFKIGGRYERDALVNRMIEDIRTTRERAPNSKIVWTMQGFALTLPYQLRMPTGPEMRDLASVVYSMDVDGALWYTWTWNQSYDDYIVNHPELYPVIREVYDEVVVR